MQENIEPKLIKETKQFLINPQNGWQTVPFLMKAKKDEHWHILVLHVIL